MFVCPKSAFCVPRVRFAFKEKLRNCTRKSDFLKYLTLALKTNLPIPTQKNGNACHGNGDQFLKDDLARRFSQ